MLMWKAIKATVDSCIFYGYTSAHMWCSYWCHSNQSLYFSWLWRWFYTLSKAIRLYLFHCCFVMSFRVLCQANNFYACSIAKSAIFNKLILIVASFTYCYFLNMKRLVVDLDISRQHVFTRCKIRNY
jgi:hypothetical protein